MFCPFSAPIFTMAPLASNRPAPPFAHDAGPSTATSPRTPLSRIHPECTSEKDSLRCRGLDPPGTPAPLAAPIFPAGARSPQALHLERPSPWVGKHCFGPRRQLPPLNLSAGPCRRLAEKTATAKMFAWYQGRPACIRNHRRWCGGKIRAVGEENSGPIGLAAHDVRRWPDFPRNPSRSPSRSATSWLGPLPRVFSHQLSPSSPRNSAHTLDDVLAPG